MCLAMVGVRSLCALVGLGPQGCTLPGLGGGSHWDGDGDCPSCLFQTPPKMWLMLLCRGVTWGDKGWWGCLRRELVSHRTLLQLCFPSCRIFVLGIGFFTLCFLMTSLGGQFSAKRLGDSPFTIRTEGKSGTVLVLPHVMLDDTCACGTAELTSTRDAGRMVLRCLHPQGSLLTHLSDVRMAQDPVGHSHLLEESP